MGTPNNDSLLHRKCSREKITTQYTVSHTKPVWNISHRFCKQLLDNEVFLHLVYSGELTTPLIMNGSHISVIHRLRLTGQWKLIRPYKAPRQKTNSSLCVRPGRVTWRSWQNWRHLVKSQPWSSVSWRLWSLLMSMLETLLIPFRGTMLLQTVTLNGSGWWYIAMMLHRWRGPWVNTLLEVGKGAHLASIPRFTTTWSCCWKAGYEAI